jgi:hypothetical protein
MSDFSHRIFKKLDRIPGAPNFVRYNYEDLVKTTKAYVAFAKGMPTVSYMAGLKIVKDLVLGWTSPEQAKITARRMKESPSKAPIIEFVDAFCRYMGGRNYQATPSYSEFETSFQIGRNLYVPVRPTLIARELGQLKPVFVFGWKSVPLNDFQRRLLMTILEDAIFSLTDFEDSDAEIVFLPEVDGVRTPEVWHRGDYNLLSESELRNQMELFLSARESAYPIIADWIKSKIELPEESKQTEEDSRQISLNLALPSSDR